MTSILFIQTKAPHSGLAGQEGLDALLMGSVFAECSLLFKGDGVLQLLAEQDTSELETKHFAKGYGALADYGVAQVHYCASSLAARGIDASELLVDATPMSAEEVRRHIQAHDKTLTF